MRQSGSLGPSRQSWAAVHLSRTGCDFSMRFCSLGFSNQKATAFCDCGFIPSEPREWEAAGTHSESAPSACHPLYRLCPRHGRFVRGRWGGEGIWGSGGRDRVGKTSKMHEMPLYLRWRLAQRPSPVRGRAKLTVSLPFSCPLC